MKPFLLYFGCWDEPGHYIFDRNRHTIAPASLDKRRATRAAVQSIMNLRAAAKSSTPLLDKLLKRGRR